MGNLHLFFQQLQVNIALGSLIKCRSCFSIFIWSLQENEHQYDLSNLISFISKAHQDHHHHDIMVPSRRLERELISVGLPACIEKVQFPYFSFSIEREARTGFSISVPVSLFGTVAPVRANMSITNEFLICAFCRCSFVLSSLHPDVSCNFWHEDIVRGVDTGQGNGSYVWYVSALQHISHTGLFSVDGVTIQWPMAFPEFSFAFNTLKERGQIVEGLLFKSDPFKVDTWTRTAWWFSAWRTDGTYIRRMYETQSRLISR